MIFNQALIHLEDKCLAIINQTLVKLGMQAPRKDGIDALNSEKMKEKAYNVYELLQYITQNKPL